MSQFYGYTVDLDLKESKNQGLKKIRGLIETINNNEVVLLNPVYVNPDGSYEKFEKNSINVKATKIADLNVVELANNDSKYIKKQMKMLKTDSSSVTQSEDSKNNNKEKDSGKSSRRSRRKKNTNNSANTSASTNNGDEESISKPMKEMEIKYVDIYAEKPKAEEQDTTTKKTKELEEFDFASNLQKFDKATVFKNISENDNIDQSSRLVSFNKIDSKDKKYGIDEMILNQKHDTNWDDNSSYDYSNLTKNVNDANVVDEVSSRSNSNAIDSAESAETNILSNRQTSNVSFGRRTSLTPHSAQFFSSSYDETPIPTCSTLQLSEIFNICKTKFGISEEIINENSGRSITDLIINNVIGSFRIGFKNHNEPPLVLILAGNNRAGAISLTAGRHLFNKGVKVISFLLYDAKTSPDELLPAVDEELKRFSDIGGKIVNSIEQLEKVIDSHPESPLEFILEGLGGFESDLNDLIGNELELAIELIEWCNISEIPIMSLDIPAGLNPSSGTNDNDERLIIMSDHIVSIGIPLSSTLNIYKFGYFEKGKLKHHLVDCGIPRRVFGSKGSLRKFDRRWFADSSVISMQLA